MTAVVRASCLLVFGLSCSKVDTRRGPELLRSDPVAAGPTGPASDPATDAGVCRGDEDCTFDDPCMPTVCVVGRARPVACDESMPAPGRCLCRDGRCALEPKAATVGCSSWSECAIDASGACVRGFAKPIARSGAYCACTAGTCVPEKVEEVRCKSWRDCSYLEQPVRPAPASEVPRRGPPVVPCKTGERDSVCEGGVCVVRAWPC